MKPRVGDLYQLAPDLPPAYAEILGVGEKSEMRVTRGNMPGVILNSAEMTALKFLLGQSLDDANAT